MDDVRNKDYVIFIMGYNLKFQSYHDLKKGIILKKKKKKKQLKNVFMFFIFWKSISHLNLKKTLVILS